MKDVLWEKIFNWSKIIFEPENAMCYTFSWILSTRFLGAVTISLSYNGLWKMLIDRKLKKKDLQNMTHLSSSVIAKMGRDESVHLDTIVKICIALQCNISDVVELQRRDT